MTNRFTGHGKFPKANAGNSVGSDFQKDGMKNILKQVVRNNFFLAKLRAARISGSII